uniref:Uncharacterized protein n=1 Tax=Euplotes harpa TaxID=151035 RepID=A0A7S3JDV1_9SPIT|mmetsp:Transcript_34548/g.39995  ORF Transcript_34548/g.39995 Transcript_34548/m.39995 type:complete len:132 (+) Transcript_34548:34-429(+)
MGCGSSVEKTSSPHKKEQKNSVQDRNSGNIVVNSPRRSQPTNNNENEEYYKNAYDYGASVKNDSQIVGKDSDRNSKAPPVRVNTSPYAELDRQDFNKGQHAPEEEPNGALGVVPSSYINQPYSYGGDSEED